MRMIIKIADLVSMAMVSSCATKYSKDTIRYGIEIILMSMLGIMIFRVISLLFYDYIGWIEFLVSFYMIRTYAGGYHASSPGKCIVLSSLIFLLSEIVASTFKFTLYSYVVLWGLSSAIVIYLAPIEPKNKKLSIENRIRNRRLSILVCLLMGVSIGVLYSFISIDLYCLGMLSASILMVIAINKRKERRV